MLEQMIEIVSRNLFPTLGVGTCWADVILTLAPRHEILGIIIVGAHNY